MSEQSIGSRPQGMSAAYAAIFPSLIPIAKFHGYGLALHGSLNRDLDIVAIPWVEECSDALTLIRALKEATGGVTTGKDFDDLIPDCRPTLKPHGRVSYSIHFTDQGAAGPYLDVSVMPKRN